MRSQNNDWSIEYIFCCSGRNVRLRMCMRDTCVFVCAHVPMCVCVLVSRSVFSLKNASTPSCQCLTVVVFPPHRACVRACVRVCIYICLSVCMCVKSVCIRLYMWACALTSSSNWSESQSDVCSTKIFSCSRHSCA